MVSERSNSNASRRKDEIGSWVRKPQRLEAVLLTADNIEKMVEWCGGRYVELGKPGDPSDVQKKIYYPTLDGNREAHVGDFLIRDKGRFRTMKKAEFEKEYDIPGARSAVEGSGGVRMPMVSHSRLG